MRPVKQLAYRRPGLADRNLIFDTAQIHIGLISVSSRCRRITVQHADGNAAHQLGCFIERRNGRSTFTDSCDESVLIHCRNAFVRRRPGQVLIRRVRRLDRRRRLFCRACQNIGRNLCRIITADCDSNALDHDRCDVNLDQVIIGIIFCQVSAHDNRAGALCRDDTVRRDSSAFGSGFLFHSLDIAVNIIDLPGHIFARCVLRPDHGADLRLPVLHLELSDIRNDRELRQNDDTVFGEMFRVKGKSISIRCAVYDADAPVFLHVNGLAAEVAVHIAHPQRNLHRHARLQFFIVFGKCNVNKSGASDQSGNRIVDPAQISG